MAWVVVMALALALGLYLGGNLGSGEPPAPSAPAFASEPGTLEAITSQNEIIPVGFTSASGYPSPTYILSGTVPEGVNVFIDDSEPVELPVAVPAAYLDQIAVSVVDIISGAIELTLTATNGVSPDAESDATIPVAIPVAPPQWSLPSYAVELPVTAPVTFGSALGVTGAATIEVTALPDKGVYYIDDGDDTPLAVNDTFPAADLALLTGESDGDTGSVTGVLTLEAHGDGGDVELDITVTIAEAAGPDITDRDFDIEEGTEANIGFDTATMGDLELASIDNQTDGGSAVIVKIPDLS